MSAPRSTRPSPRLAANCLRWSTFLVPPGSRKWPLTAPPRRSPGVAVQALTQSARVDTSSSIPSRAQLSLCGLFRSGDPHQQQLLALPKLPPHCFELILVEILAGAAEPDVFFLVGVTGDEILQYFELSGPPVGHLIGGDRHLLQLMLDRLMFAGALVRKAPRLLADRRVEPAVEHLLLGARMGAQLGRDFGKQLLAIGTILAVHDFVDQHSHFIV